MFQGERKRCAAAPLTYPPLSIWKEAGKLMRFVDEYRAPCDNRRALDRNPVVMLFE